MVLHFLAIYPNIYPADSLSGIYLLGKKQIITLPPGLVRGVFKYL